MPTNLKIIAGAFIITAIIGFIKWGHDVIWQAGYDAATVKCEQAKGDKKEKIDNENLEIINKLDEIKEDTAPAPSIIETVEIVKYVEKTIEKEVYVCDNVGANLIGVLNNNRNRIFGEPSIDSTGD